MDDTASETVREPAPAPVPEPSEPSEPSELIERIELIETELLVEEISIDGMCGVY